MNIDTQSANPISDSGLGASTDKGIDQLKSINNVNQSKDDTDPLNVYNVDKDTSVTDVEKAEEKAEEKASIAKELTKAEVEKVAQQLQEFVKSLNRNVSFSVDEESGRNVISVVEVKSGELIRQIPSEEILKLASRISKAAGLIVQEEV